MSDFNNNQCGSCYFLRDKRNDSIMFCGSCNEKGYCLQIRSYYYPDDSICSHYRNKDSYVPGNGCFITTIVCEMLCLDDKCNVLETLRGFRDNVMHKDEKYASLLHEYDTVGPQIAKELRDENDYELANAMLDYYILPTVCLVKEKKYDEAVNKYAKMTKALENYYGIQYNGEIEDKYNYVTGGHGVKVYV